MKVRFADDVLRTPGAFVPLTRILSFFLNEKHLWNVSPRQIDQSEWANDPGFAGRYIREVLEKCIVKDIYQRTDHMHTLTLVVTLASQPPMALAPEDAERILGLPAFVVVENGESDRAFLAAMMRAFGRDGLQESLKLGWWEIVSAGGSGEIPKRVAECLSKVGNGPRRVMILSDSDRGQPGERTTTVEKMEACAAANGIWAIVLRKRDIENYLPPAALRHVRQAKQAELQAYLALTAEDQDHHDMKKSFGKRVWELFDNAAKEIDETAVRASCARDPDEIPLMLDVIERML